jgi:endoglucanase
VENGRIVDKDGQPTQLIGMSFFWSNWMGQYYTRGVVDTLVDDWGASVLRVSMGIPDSGDGGYLVNPTLEMDKVETVVNACITRGIYVIIDWHDHHAEDHVQEATTFFGQVAKKYGHHPNVLFEPYNEPLNVDWASVIKPYHAHIIAAIRAHSQNIIILGTRNWCQELDEATANPVDDDNVAYCLHFYASSHGAFLREKAQKALDRGRAVFVSEWGTCEYTGNGALDLDEVNAWHNWMDQNVLSSANWAISDKQESCSALLPGASAEGNWNGEEHLTESGRWVRRKIQGATGTPTPTLTPPTPTTPTPSTQTPEPTESTPKPTSGTSTQSPTPKPPTLSAQTREPTEATPTPTSGSSAQVCNVLYARCGGIGWSGPICCKGDSFCEIQNPWYSQCLPSAGKTEKQPEADPKPNSPEPTGSPIQSCNALYAKCGGMDWDAATCCEGDSVCKYQNPWYSQCIPQQNLLQSAAKDMASGRARSRMLRVHRPHSGDQVLMQSSRFIDHGTTEL